MSKVAMANALKQMPTAQKARRSGMQAVMIIRHGTTKMNSNDDSVDKIRGWKDIPLSEEGRQEAEKLGGKLKANPPAILVSSDLKRAAETADIISKIIGVPVSEKSQGFRPWNVGDYAGQSSKIAVPVLAKYATDKPDEALPGGESFHQFEGRFFNALSDCIQKYGSKGTIAIVTHHRDERLLHAWIAAGCPDDGEIDKSVFNQKGETPGSITELDLEPDRIAATAKDLSKSSKLKSRKGSLYGMGGES